MNQLEKTIRVNYNKAILDASLPAARLYEKLNYKTIQHEKYPVENGVVLVYEVMEKESHKVNTVFSYDGKQFSPKSNSENGEVDGETIFNYHQDGTILWAEYQGGDVVRGFLVGTVSDNGELDFTYQHINVENQLRIGRCHSVPRNTENGKIELLEEWQWMNGDCSKGSSMLVEI